MASSNPQPGDRPPRSFTLAELARRGDCELRGDGGRVIDGVATLAGAGPKQISFLANARYRNQLADCRAAAVIVSESDAQACPVDRLISADPYRSFALIARAFETKPIRPPGIHPTAVVAESAWIDPAAHIGPHCSIGDRSRIGAGAVIGPGCVIGEDCAVGDGCELVARVTLVDRVTLGQRVLIHPGAVLGADGFGLAKADGRWLKVPQLGGVTVGDDCEIGANTTIDRGALEDTVLEEDVRLDNQVQIGHNVRIGAHTALAGCVGVAGSTRIGRRCLLGGAVGVVGHLEICDDVTVTGFSMVSSSIRSPGVYGSGIPAQDHRQWQRNLVRLHHLNDTTRRLLALNNKKDTEGHD